MERVLTRTELMEAAVDVIGLDTILRLADELRRARNKYPNFAVNHAEAVDVVESEFLEWKSQAMRANTPDGLRSAQYTERRNKAEGEAWHLVVTALRYIGREYDKAPR